MLLCSLTAPFYYRLGLTSWALTSEKISKKRGDQTVLWSNRLIGIFCCVRINRQFWVSHIHMLQGRHWLVRCPLCNTPLESSDRQYSLDRWNPAWFCTSSINHHLQVAEDAVPPRWHWRFPPWYPYSYVHQMPPRFTPFHTANANKKRPELLRLSDLLQVHYPSFSGLRIYKDSDCEVRLNWNNSPILEWVYLSPYIIHKSSYFRVIYLEFL